MAFDMLVNSNDFVCEVSHKQTAGKENKRVKYLNIASYQPRNILLNDNLSIHNGWDTLKMHLRRQKDGKDQTNKNQEVSPFPAEDIQGQE